MNAGLAVSHDGTSRRIDDVTDDILRRMLGEKFESVDAPNGAFRIHVHQMNRVAHLPVNGFVSVKSGLLISGSVILTGIDRSPLDPELFSAATKKSVKEMANDESLKSRLEQLRRERQSDQRFSLYPPDRWLMNGLAFVSIVIGESEDHGEDGIDRHDVWLFGEDPEKPFFVKIAEYSLLEVMELLIDVDERTSQGDVPEEFRSVVNYLGL